MTATVARYKLEILADAPLVHLVVEAGRKAGLRGYTIVPTVAGEGRTGSWSDDQVSGVQAKVMYVSVTTLEKSQALIDALAPYLDDYGFVVLRSQVEVVRADRFR